MQRGSIPYKGKAFFLVVPLRDTTPYVVPRRGNPLREKSPGTPIPRRGTPSGVKGYRGSIPSGYKSFRGIGRLVCSLFVRGEKDSGRLVCSLFVIPYDKKSLFGSFGKRKDTTG